jgi:hypothetical protein
VPKDSVIQYETALKADAFLVTAHGTADELARARTVLADANPSSLQLHHGTIASAPADVTVPGAQ